MRNSALTCCVCIVALTLSACRGEEKKAADAGQPSTDGVSLTYAPGTPELNAIVTEAASDLNAVPLKLSGRLAWNEERTVQVFTPFAGRVMRILAQPGQRVKKRQALALVASPDFGQAQSDAKRAQADFGVADQSLKRVRELFGGGVLSQRELTAAEADFMRAEAELKRTSARITLYGNPGLGVSQEFSLSSPIDGVVVDRAISPGQELRPDAQTANLPPSFVVSNPDTLWFLLDLQESDIAFVSPGQTVALLPPAFPGERFQGTVQTVSDFIDPATRTLRVRGVIDNRGRRLKAGMFANAEVERKGPPKVQVSSKAVFLVGEKYYVFVDEGKGKFTRLEVRIGPEHVGRMAIESGLRVGQAVVTDGTLQLQQMLRNSSSKS